MNKMKFVLLILAISSVLGGVSMLYNEHMLDSMVMAAKVLFAFFPLLIAAIWLHERKNYFR